VRAALAAASAGAEAALFASLRDVAGPGAALAYLALALPSPGMYAAAPALLPSSFVMVAHAGATAAALRLVGGPLKNRTRAARATIVAAAVGLLWGWPVAAPAFLPAAAAVLALAPSLVASIRTALAVSVALLTPLILADRAAYGRWTLSLANFLAYNVAGGGDSALYGVEPPSFYGRAALLGAGLCVPLASAQPLLTWAAGLRGGAGRGSATPSPGAGRAVALVALAPAALWVAAITALPHKEDRFLYPIFPALHAAAGTGLACLPALVRAACGVRVHATAKGTRGSGGGVRAAVPALASAAPVVVALAAACLGLARSAALATFYSAPRTVWASLPPHPGPAFNASSPALVCMGAEWHRFPGSWALPDPTLFRPAFVSAGFGGLLPVPFGPGGSAAAPPTLNDRNRREAVNELPDTSTCAFFVGVAPENGGDAPNTGREWEVVRSARFVDVGGRRAGGAGLLLGRWLYVRGVRWGGLDGAGNAWVRYVLVRRREQRGTVFV